MALVPTTNPYDTAEMALVPTANPYGTALPPQVMAAQQQ